VTTRAIATSLVLIELGMMIVFPFRPPIDVPSPTLPMAALATISLLAMLAAVVAARSGRSWWLVGVGVVWLAAIVARVLVVGADVAPNFDVPLFQEEAARLLLGGHNPYETTVIAAYPYGPVAIIGAAIGHVLGDVRWSRSAQIWRQPARSHGPGGAVSIPLPAPRLAPCGCGAELACSSSGKGFRSR